MSETELRRLTCVARIGAAILPATGLPLPPDDNAVTLEALATVTAVIHLSATGDHTPVQAQNLTNALIDTLNRWSAVGRN